MIVCFMSVFLGGLICCLIVIYGHFEFELLLVIVSASVKFNMAFTWINFLFGKFFN